MISRDQSSKAMEADSQFMSEAIEAAKRGGNPFGCVIVMDGKMVVKAFNTVKKENDPTAHAEINAIRSLGKLKLPSHSPLTLYTTCEPCPMCMSAIVFAGIGKVVFGASIAEISRCYKQIDIPAEEVALRGFGSVEVKGGVMAEQCLDLLKNKKS